VSVPLPALLVRSAKLTRKKKLSLKISIALPLFSRRCLRCALHLHALHPLRIHACCWRLFQPVGDAVKRHQQAGAKISNKAGGPWRREQSVLKNVAKRREKPPAGAGAASGASSRACSQHSWLKHNAHGISRHGAS